MTLRSRSYLRESEYKVGFSWEAPGGKRQISGMGPSGKFLVTAPGKSVDSMGQQILSSGDVDFEIRRDTANLKSREDSSRRSGDEEKARLEREDTHGFADRFPPHRKKKILNALMTIMRFNGKAMSRKQYVEKVVAKGAKIGKWKGMRTIEQRNGSFIEEKKLTKTAVDYAEFLIGRGWR